MAAAANHADTGQALQLMFTLNTRMKRKCDLCDFGHGMDAGTRRAVSSIS